MINSMRKQLLSLTMAVLMAGSGSAAFAVEIPVDKLNIKPLGTVSAKQKQAFTQQPFDPKGSVRPKTIKDNTVSGVEAVIDADGTETVLHSRFPYTLFISPDHSAHVLYEFSGKENKPGHEEMYLFVPNGKKVAGKGHGVTQYYFTRESGDEVVDQCDAYYTDKNDYVPTLNQMTKAQTLNENWMTCLDFVTYKIAPKNPKKTVVNHILNGRYKHTDSQIVGSTTPVTMNFSGKDLTLRCDDLNINGTYGYKLEPVGKNAYKLFLYNRSVVKNEDTGKYDKAGYAGQPEGHTFFLYMDAQNKFDFVYFTDLNRHSVTMTR
jgi:hypothetical protein